MFRLLYRHLTKTRDAGHKREMQKYNLPCFLKIEISVLQQISILTLQERLKIIVTKGLLRDDEYL